VVFGSDPALWGGLQTLWKRRKGENVEAKRRVGGLSKKKANRFTKKGENLLSPAPFWFRVVTMDRNYPILGA